MLNLSASQTIRTERNVNRAFDFTWDESETRLRLDLDTPLNRRAQRNAYRRSLIDYNRALRNLIELEDNVKFDVREDLHQLQVDREQYEIAVASAALAYERVLSNRLQLQFGLPGISARDVLEAQQAYTASLSAVARAHITYLLGRIDLFLDLESLEVDNDGFWPYLHDEQYQPTPRGEIPTFGRPVYGCLPRGVWYSHAIRRMVQVPAGYPEIHRQPSSPDSRDGSQTGPVQANPAEAPAPSQNSLRARPEEIPAPPPGATETSQDN